MIISTFSDIILQAYLVTFLGYSSLLFRQLMSSQRWLYQSSAWVEGQMNYLMTNSQFNTVGYLLIFVYASTACYEVVVGIESSAWKAITLQTVALLQIYLVCLNALSVHKYVTERSLDFMNQSNIEEVLIPFGDDLEDNSYSHQ